MCVSEYASKILEVYQNTVLIYYLITNEKCDEDLEFGLAVEKVTRKNKFSNYEKCSFNAISNSRDEVLKLLEIISSGKVTPCTLPDIIEDYMHQ